MTQISWPRNKALQVLLHDCRFIPIHIDVQVINNTHNFCVCDLSEQFWKVVPPQCTVRVVELQSTDCCSNAARGNHGWRIHGKVEVCEGRKIHELYDLHGTFYSPQMDIIAVECKNTTHCEAYERMGWFCNENTFHFATCTLEYSEILSLHLSHLGMWPHTQRSGQLRG